MSSTPSSHPSIGSNVMTNPFLTLITISYEFVIFGSLSTPIETTYQKFI